MKTSIAPAKVNLALHITGKRADGYHLMESLVAFSDIGDEIRIEPAKNLSLSVEGKFAHLCGNVENNLVLKAAQLLQQVLSESQGAHITLIKHLPVGAGLGGGSSDAAMVAKMLLQFWAHIMPDTILIRHLSALGADLAMCITAKPLIARGIGDEIEVLKAFPAIPILLVWPDTLLSTVDVYRRYQHEVRPIPSMPEATRDIHSLLQALAQTRNDLQHPAIACASHVAEALLALETLPQRPVVRMTGSGACCVAYFADASSADKAATYVEARYPHWWSKRASLLGC